METTSGMSSHMIDVTTPDTALSQQLLTLLSCSKLNQSLLNDELTKYINIIASRMAASSSSTSTDDDISSPSKLPSSSSMSLVTPPASACKDETKFSFKTPPSSSSKSSHITHQSGVSSAAEKMNETTAANLDEMSEKARLDTMTATLLAYSTLKNAGKILESASTPVGSLTSAPETPPRDTETTKPDIFPTESHSQTMDSNIDLPRPTKFSSLPTYHAPSRKHKPSPSKYPLPFPLDSYWQHTTPVCDMTYTVLPFATIARTLNLTKDPEVLQHELPAEHEVEDIKLLDLWGILGWFALQYITSAELLANNRDLLLMHLGNWMRYVNTARHEQEQNIVAFQIQHDIYFEVIRDILPGQELLLWYESSYGDLLGLYRLEQLRPDPDGCYSCQMCHRTFCYPYSFMMHIATRACSNAGSQVLWCDHCGMVFALPATLRSHVRTHSHERPFPCSTCPSTFAQSSALTLHNQIHWYQNTDSWYSSDYKSGSVPPPPPPPLLSPTISSSNGITTLPAHSTTMLVSDKIFKCNKCNKAFSCNAKLERHTRVHSGVKPYTCDYCGKSFAYSTSCRRHERTHVEGKPFKCTHCQKAFSDSTNMKAHIRIHTGEKPYRCNICGREFSHSSSLKSHHRTHTGEKPFKCSHCGTCFGHLSTLRKHGMRAHGLQKRSHLQDEGQVVVKAENPGSLIQPYPKPIQPLSHIKPDSFKSPPGADLYKSPDPLPPLSHSIKGEPTFPPLSHSNRPTIAAADSSNILHVLSPERSAIS